MNKTLENFNSLIRRTIREDIQIDYILHDSNHSILGNEGKIEQIIMNLVLNAQEAMSTGGTISIKVSSKTFSNENKETMENIIPGPYILFEVSDTGKGIEPLIEHIFEPFFTTKDNGKGSGLGLATV